MRRVEIIAPQKKFDEVMLYLREQNAIELLDVKEMIKGYGGGVTPTTVSDRLYRLTTLESKINSIVAALGIGSKLARPVTVGPRISDQQIADIENTSHTTRTTSHVNQQRDPSARIIDHVRRTTASKKHRRDHED